VENIVGSDPSANPIRGRTNPHPAASAWVKHSGALAAWTMKHLVNRADAYGSYIASEKRTDPDRTALTIKGELTLAVLKRHFTGASTGDLVGLHSTVRDEATGPAELGACWSRWLAVDIDRHYEATDPGATLEAAVGWHDVAESLGFRPLILDSNGRGGYHLVLLFDGPVDTSKVHAFGKWLARDWKDQGLDREPEIFPKQAEIAPGGFGNWLRLPGRHHTRDHFTRVWNGSVWLDGTAAVKRILRASGVFSEAIPAEALAPPTGPRKPKGKVEAKDYEKDAQLAAEALDYLDPSMPYPEWLRVGMSLTPLGRDGLNLWDRWSSSSDKYQDGLCDRKWRSFARSGLTLGTLFHEAKAKGFEFPKDRKTSTNGRHVGNGKPPAVPPQPPRQSEPAIAPEPGRRPNEANDDPHRLARIFLQERCSHPERSTLVFHKGEFHRWDGAYEVLSEKDVRAELAKTVKGEFDRINVREIETREPGKPPPKAARVTSALINNVTLALSGYSLLGARVEPPAWLDEAPNWPARQILPARNGLLHLPSFVEGKRALMPPTPLFFCPYNIGYDFDPKAATPAVWLDFLRKLWEDDSESVATLQDWFGYHLTPDVSHQKIGTIIGPKRSGKGTIVRILTSMIGQANACNPTLSSLGTQFGNAVLIGKLAAMVTDARISGRSDIAQIVENLLSISGEDGKTIQRKHLPDWTGKLMTKFTIISNETPRLADSSGALSGRMVILKLTKSFYGQEDRRLFDKLIPELPGILLWAIEGWKRLNERGHFVQPQSGVPLVEEMEELSSPIGTFVRDCCQVGSGREIETGKLFSAWKEWCQKMNREHAGDQQSFGRNLRTVLPTLETKPAKRGGEYYRIFQGIELNPPAF
jgi:putative DNA primase/helicase